MGMMVGHGYQYDDSGQATTREGYTGGLLTTTNHKNLKNEQKDLANNLLGKINSDLK
jgi:hypothetical protein